MPTYCLGLPVAIGIIGIHIGSGCEELAGDLIGIVDGIDAGVNICIDHLQPVANLVIDDIMSPLVGQPGELAQVIIVCQTEE
ncbi:MAG: hypothetical protein CVU89_09570 [Firmicutes bacterium HGW-Firmicutes-14]|nr:MAG: hypothetical protein CVU89_09570 [Firmicutes bacterium HGW-Firmicutes-14]